MSGLSRASREALGDGEESFAFTYHRIREGGRGGRQSKWQGDGFPEIEAFSWIRGTVIGDAACLTLVWSGDRDAVARGFGGDPRSARRSSLEAARDEFADAPWIGVRMVGSWVLAVEVNGWQGSRPEVLERVSAGTRAVSAYGTSTGRPGFPTPRRAGC